MKKGEYDKTNGGIGVPEGFLEKKKGCTMERRCIWCERKEKKEEKVYWICCSDCLRAGKISLAQAMSLAQRMNEKERRYPVSPRKYGVTV